MSLIGENENPACHEGAAIDAKLGSNNEGESEAVSDNVGQQPPPDEASADEPVEPAAGATTTEESITNTAAVVKKTSTTTPTWHETFEELRRYKEKNGHCVVPTLDPHNKRLGKWISRQRLAKKQNQLSTERVAQLDSIGGFVWDCQAFKSEQQFQDKLAKLKAHKLEHNGSLHIARDTAALRDLAMWCSKQRQVFKLGQLQPERKAQLDEVGFVWDPNPATDEQAQAKLEREEMEWMESYQKLKELRSDGKEDPDEVNDWLSQQRKRYASDALLDHRQKMLEDIGIMLEKTQKPSVQEDRWKEKLQRLLDYQKANNTLEVPVTDTEQTDLHRWIKRQRMLDGQRSLESSRKERLLAIGFDLKASEDTQGQPATHAAHWEAKYERLEAFGKEHGHVNVTGVFKAEVDLYRWVRRQRELFKNKKLDPPRIKRLEALGFSWSLVRIKKPDSISPADLSPGKKKQGDKWELQFARLKKYEEENKNGCCVPRDYEADQSLAHFVSNQRKLYRASKIPDDRKAKLDGIGFTWQIKQHRGWDDNYNRLKEYKKEHGGSTNVPCRYKSDYKLGSFVNFQRRRYRENKLPQQQKELLEAIGFQFEVPTEAQLRRKTERPKLKEVENVRVTASNEKKWDDMFACLQEYKKEHGHANVPLRYKKNRKLGKWLSHQRLSCNRKDRVTKLDTIGFVWDATTLTARKRRLDGSNTVAGAKKARVEDSIGTSEKTGAIDRDQQHGYITANAHSGATTEKSKVRLD